MIRRLSDIETAVEEGALAGMRMTADEFLEAVAEDHNYELVDGVVIMSPSGTPIHQRVAGEILHQLISFLDEHPVGAAVMEGDVKIGKGPMGGDLVYKPEVVFYRSERLSGMNKRLAGPPDLVVEVISPSSRLYDLNTKRDDYERLGVGEYWLFDPDGDEMTFFRLENGLFVEIAPSGDAFRSESVPGFALNLKRVRRAGKPW